MQILCLVFLIRLLLLASPAHAGELRAIIKDQEGKAVEDAVLLATPADPTKLPHPKPSDEIVDQIDKEFVPYVKPVLVGSMVHFPNKDNIRHHVYSFSPVKIFELPLYSGKTAPPVLFDKPGVVILGCNIHDWMLGYIYVSDTPFFTKTRQDGKASIEGLPAGEYLVRLWHPRMGDPGGEAGRRVTIDEKTPAKIEWQITLKQVFRIPRASANQGAHYH